jgi:hypothetical protein
LTKHPLKRSKKALKEKRKELSALKSSIHHILTIHPQCSKKNIATLNTIFKIILNPTEVQKPYKSEIKQ